MTTLGKAIETYGKDMQLTVAVEELSELIKEICKNRRGADNRDNIVEEIADCYIMLDQLIMIFGIRGVEVKRVIDEKLARLEERLAERSENEQR
jgi:NTP pyrophosphatase (non-canonical NTP hydrolase)